MRRWARLRSFAEPLLTTGTTDLLSQQQLTLQDCHLDPQTVADRKMGRNSIKAKLGVCISAGYLNSSHFSSQKMPQPHEPDASEVRYIRRHERGRNANPFHVVNKRMPPFDVRVCSVVEANHIVQVPRDFG